MPNTTGFTIVCWEDDGGLKEFVESTGWNFKKITDAGKAGGYVCMIESYAFARRADGIESIDECVEKFRAANFEFPEYACLIIDCDNEAFNGIVLHSPKFTKES